MWRVTLTLVSLFRKRGRKRPGSRPWENIRLRPRVRVKVRVRVRVRVRVGVRVRARVRVSLGRP